MRCLHIIPSKEKRQAFYWSAPGGNSLHGKSEKKIKTDRKEREPEQEKGKERPQVSIHPFKMQKYVLLSYM